MLLNLTDSLVVFISVFEQRIKLLVHAGGALDKGK
jgi:hypothetical protein